MESNPILQQVKYEGSSETGSVEVCVVMVQILSSCLVVVAALGCNISIISCETTLFGEDREV